MRKATAIQVVLVLLLVGCSTPSMPGKVPVPDSVRTRLLPDFQKQEYATEISAADYALLKTRRETTCEVVDGEYVYFIKQQPVGGDGPNGEWTGVKFEGVFRTKRR